MSAYDLQQLKSPHNTAMSRMSYQGTAGSSSSIVGGGLKPQEVSPLQQVLMQPSQGVDDLLQSPPYPQAQQSFMSATSDKIGANSRGFQQQQINPSPYVGNTGMLCYYLMVNSLFDR